MPSHSSSISSLHLTVYQRGANREPIYQCPLLQINVVPGILCQLFRFQGIYHVPSKCSKNFKLFPWFVSERDSIWLPRTSPEMISHILSDECLGCLLIADVRLCGCCCGCVCRQSVSIYPSLMSFCLFSSLLLPALLQGSDYSINLIHNCLCVSGLSHTWIELLQTTSAMTVGSDTSCNECVHEF